VQHLSATSTFANFARSRPFLSESCHCSRAVRFISRLHNGINHEYPLSPFLPLSPALRFCCSIYHARTQKSSQDPPDRLQHVHSASLGSLTRMSSPQPTPPVCLGRRLIAVLHRFLKLLAIGPVAGIRAW